MSRSASSVTYSGGACTLANSFLSDEARQRAGFFSPVKNRQTLGLPGFKCVCAFYREKINAFVH